jgi:hypothetical protein
MLPVRLLTLLLCVLLPLSARAQAPEQVTPPPLIPAPEAPETSEVPEGELIPRPLPSEADSSSWRGQRIPLQILGGTAAAGAAILVTLGLFSLDSQSCDGFFCNPSVFLFGLGAGGVGLMTGPPLAIWGIGEALDDRGRFWPTLGGGALGTLATVLSLLALDAHLPPELNVALASLWPVISSMIVYELTRRGPAPSGTVDSGLQVFPVVGMSRHGGIVGGLVGSF